MGKPYSQHITAGSYAKEITTLDTDFVDGVAKELWIGVEGDINVTFGNGQAVTGMPALAGLFPFKVIQVNTGTTAENIWAVY